MSSQHMDAYTPANGGGPPPSVQAPRHAPHAYGAEDPEDFYRPASTVTDSHNNNGSSTTSPANSEAPIMKWAQSNHSDYPSASSTPDPTRHQQQYPRLAYPQPPPIPEVYNYRTSMGVVNGEVGGSGYTAPYTASVHTPTAPPPLSVGLKAPATYKEEEGTQADFTAVDEKVFKDSQRDLAVKLKIRLVKVVLRSVNCACSLIVLSLLASTFAIFNSTKNLAPRSGFTAWSTKTPKWPQITVLCIACISLTLSLWILYSYWKGGHKRASKAAFYATIFAAGGFIFSCVVWGVSIGIMQGSRATSEAQDLWGWACKDNQRRQLFQDTVNYKLDWVVVCAIIEIVVETISIAVYVFAFYRFHTKRQLRKSMSVRDDARASVWLAKLKEQQDAEADPEVSMNTAYNMHTNGSVAYASAEEGRAVPILQPPPPGHHHHASANAQSQEQTKEEIPPPPPSAMFRRDSLVPPTPRSVSFQPTPHVQSD